MLRTGKDKQNYIKESKNERNNKHALLNGGRNRIRNCLTINGRNDIKPVREVQEPKEIIMKPKEELSALDF